MADDTVTSPPAAQAEPVSASPPSTKPEDNIAEGGPVEAPDAMEVDEPKDTADAAAQGAREEDKVDASASTAEPSTTNGAAPASSKKASQAKRKSVSGTPAKKLNRKKSMPDLHLNARPGDFWFVQMKGYPQWPAVICDEGMLPESLLSKRPVSAMRVDGTYRADFEEGGKNVRDRRYPVMFLGTNEFAWQVNTDLVPLDMDELKEQVAKGDSSKKVKALWSAYEIAAEEHDLSYFRQMLLDHERHVAEETQRLEEEQEQKLAKKEKKSKKAVDDDGDVAMEDAEEGTEKKKSSKKRKKAGAEGEDEGEKKPKIVLKGLKASAQEDAAPKPKKARKSKGPAVEQSEEPEAKSIEGPPLTEEERLKERQKTIYYLRHKLQKGLVTRDKPPQPSDMDTMDEHLSVLEQHQDLEPAIIKETKVNKLLKVILKLASIPRDEEFKFKDRCQKLLDAWTAILNGGEKPAETSTNGVANGKAETPTAKSEPAVNGTADASEEKEEVKEKEEQHDAEASGAAEASKAEEAVETS